MIFNKRTSDIYIDLFTFSYLKVEKVFFWGQIFEVEIFDGLILFEVP